MDFFGNNEHRTSNIEQRLTKKLDLSTMVEMTTGNFSLGLRLRQSQGLRQSLGLGLGLGLGLRLRQSHVADTNIIDVVSNEIVFAVYIIDFLLFFSKK